MVQKQYRKERIYKLSIIDKILIILFTILLIFSVLQIKENSGRKTPQEKKRFNFGLISAGLYLLCIIIKFLP